MELGVVLYFFGIVQISLALQCYECHNSLTNEDCLKTGRLKTCIEKEAICEDQIRHEDEGKVMIIEKRCKQRQACITNVEQNLRPAYPIQCHIGSPTSACRCCCSTNGCNKDLLACWEAYPKYNMSAPEAKDSCGVFPDKPSSGDMQCQGNNLPGATCEFKCHAGCYLSGKPKLTCLKNFTWDFPVPRCKVKKCLPKLVPPKNGFIECTNRNFLRSRCTYKCKRNYHLVGTPSAMCEDMLGKRSRKRGKWTTKKRPVCQPSVCKPQGPLIHGGFRCTDRRRVGSTCVFQCQKNYVLYPKEWKTNYCKRNGEWNRPFPCCNLPCPPNAIVDLIVVLDSSSSVKEQNWIKMKDFVRTLLSHFTVRKDSAQYGVFRYNGMVDTKTQILLSDFPDNKESFFKAFDKIPYDGSGTKTGQALEHVASTMFRKGNRTKAPDMVLLLTDGKSSDDVRFPAKRVRDAGARLLVLPIKPPGGKIDLRQVYQIAGPGNRDNVLTEALEGGFDALDASLATKLSKILCPSPCANPFHKHPGYTPTRLAGYGP